MVEGGGPRMYDMQDGRMFCGWGKGRGGRFHRMSEARSVKLGGSTYLYIPIISTHSVGKGRAKRVKEIGRGRERRGGGVVASDMRARSCWPLALALALGTLFCKQQNAKNVQRWRFWLGSNTYELMYGR